MGLRIFLIAGAVMPMALAAATVAAERPTATRLAQASEGLPCPADSECPPPAEGDSVEAMEMPDESGNAAAQSVDQPAEAPEDPEPAALADPPASEPAVQPPAQEDVVDQGKQRRDVTEEQSGEPKKKGKGKGRAKTEVPAPDATAGQADSDTADQAPEAAAPPAEDVEQAGQPDQEIQAQPPEQEAVQADPAPASDKQPAEDVTAAPPAEDTPAQAPPPTQPAAGEQGLDDDVIDRATRRRDALRQRQESDAARSQPEAAAPQPTQGADAPEPVPEDTPSARQDVAPATGDATDRATRRRETLRQRKKSEAAEDRSNGDAGTASRTPDQDDTVEKQLKAQGDEEEADNVRALRGRLLDQLGRVVGASAAQQLDASGDDRSGDDRGRRFFSRDRQRGNVVDERGGRAIIDLGGGNIYVEPSLPDEGGRLLYGARDVEVQYLPGGRTRTIVYRGGDIQIVTIRDRYGDIIRRSRLLPDGREIVLIDNRFPEDDGDRLPSTRDVRPSRIDIPPDRYIVDLGRASQQDVRRALLAPPVQVIDRPFSLDEVLRNEQIRAYSPRIDLDTITFPFGSATIGKDQVPALLALGEAMEQVIAENPDEVYLIEGHTDAVGTDYDNLILSDQRAETVAVVLSQNFDIPPENLITEGYGEQYLKVMTAGPERRNRRATVRRLTELLQARN